MVCGTGPGDLEGESERGPGEGGDGGDENGCSWLKGPGLRLATHTATLGGAADGPGGQTAGQGWWAAAATTRKAFFLVLVCLARPDFA